MKKMIFAAAMLGIMSTAALADDRCNPSQGNWQNAATQSCAVSDNGGDKFKPPCEMTK